MDAQTCWGLKGQWSVNHPCSAFAWDSPYPRLQEEPTGGTKGKSSSLTHHRKRDLKLFEKRRRHPSLTRQGMQPGQAHTNALGPTPRGKARPKVRWVIQSGLPILPAGRGTDELPSGKEICPIPTACTGHRQTQRCHQQNRVRPASAERGLLL